MRLLFCAEPIDPGRPDWAYEHEASAAERAGFDLSLVNYALLVRSGDAGAAVGRVPRLRRPELAVYRGWMLTVDQYRALYHALTEDNVRLITDAIEYRRAQHLPEWYPRVEAHTQRSVWLRCGRDVGTDAVMAALAPLGGGPVTVRDFVLSRPHDWETACFIPSAADRDAVRRVVERFIDLQGDDFTGGLVFRAYEPEPEAEERAARRVRVWLLDGSVFFWSAAHGERLATGIEPPLPALQAALQAVESRFFVADCTVRADGSWQIDDLGDGQVAGLPEHADPLDFYAALRAAWPAR